MLTVCSVCGIADPAPFVGGEYTTHPRCYRLMYGRWYERIGQAIINTIFYAFYWTKAWFQDMKERIFNA